MQKKEEKVFNYKTVVIMLGAILFLSSLNMCNSCSNKTLSKKNEKAIVHLDSTLSSTNTLIIQVGKQIDTIPGILQVNDDWQTAKFLYWERKADAPAFRTYTPKDYFELIKKD